jgi:cbb3-type cytochrome oxidase maturation protein
MEAIFVLLPLALLIAAVAVGFFVWAARTGQFDDLDTPALRILFDDEEFRHGELTNDEAESQTNGDVHGRAPVHGHAGIRTE